MNEKAKSVMKFMEQNPEYKGKFVGWTKKDDLGISRVDAADGTNATNT